MSIESGRLQRGMTLIELVFAIVIISVAVAGVLRVYITAVRSSADPMVAKQMLAIAEGMVEEIALKPYGVVAASGTPATCARNTFNDIWDYQGYATSGVICDVDGNTLPTLNGYSVNVTVVLDATTFSAVGVTQTAKITVNVSNAGHSLSLVTWRTNYAV